MLLLLRSTTTAPAARPMLRRCRCSSTSSPSRLVRWAVQEDGVATVTLSNPGKLNALTVPLGRQFEAAIDEIVAATAAAAAPSSSGAGAGKGDVRAVVLTGEGKAFSAGGDLAWLDERRRTSPQHNVDVMRRFYASFLSVRRLPVPVVAAINGAAIGAGLCLAMATDLRIAAKDAKLGFTFASLGLHPGMAATHFLPRLLPQQTAARLLLTGEVVSGEEAQRLGLVAESAPQAEVLPRALALAGQMARNSPVAVRMTLKTLRSQQEEGLDLSLRREADAQALCYTTADFKEGLEAVGAKRAPVFGPWEP